MAITVKDINGAERNVASRGWYRALDKVKRLISLHINKLQKLNKSNRDTYNNMILL